jgi:diguanylate cyclase (GGDEF)-like protein
VVERSVRLRDEHGRPCRVVYVVDDTVRREAERALRATHRFTQSVLDGLSAHVCVIDHVGSIIAVNRAWRDFAAANGAAPGAVRKGANYIAVCEAAERSGAPDATEAGPFLDLLRDALAGRRRQFEIAYTCHSPTAQRWFIAPVSRIDGSDPPSFVIAHDDVTELQQAQALLRRQASTDELTDTLNRRHFRLALNAEFERVRRQPGLCSAVLTFDVDHFKRVNDTWGHAAGDAMLQHITRRVRGHTRVIDVVARIGGEEFALLLPDTTLDEAVALGRRLGSDIATHPLAIDGQHIDVSISSGISLLDAADDSAEAAQLRADQALYDAKNAGRNTVRWRLRE